MSMYSIRYNRTDVHTLGSGTASELRRLRLPSGSAGWPRVQSSDPNRSDEDDGEDVGIACEAFLPYDNPARDETDEASKGGEPKNGQPKDQALDPTLRDTGPREAQSRYGKQLMKAGGDLLVPQQPATVPIGPFPSGRWARYS